MRPSRETVSSFYQRPASEPRPIPDLTLTDRSASDHDLRALKRHLKRTTPFSDLIRQFDESLRPLELSTEAHEVLSIEDTRPSERWTLEEAEAAEEQEQEPPAEARPLSWLEMEARLARRPQQTPSETKVLGLVRWARAKRSKPPRVLNLNQAYQFRSCLKRGARSTVNTYYSSELQKVVAIKCIDKGRLTCEELTKFLPREVSACLRVVHPNILAYIEVFETGLKKYIVMEWCEKGSLTKYIRERGKLDSVIYRKFLAQLVSAVDYCFRVDLLHRKISCDNIMVTRKNNIKLGDFSFAKEAKKDEATQTLCGVLAFSAPEILECQPSYDPYLSEVWSIGVVTYCMVYGVLPFDPTQYAKLLKQVREPIVFKRYPDTPYPCLHLMHNMIAPASRRYTLHMVMSEPWLQEESPILETEEKWPPATVEPWKEVRENIEILKEKFNHEIMRRISEYTSDLFFDKLQRMNRKKRKHETVPDRLEWLNKFYAS